jgi:hypothetical protein
MLDAVIEGETRQKSGVKSWGRLEWCLSEVGKSLTLIPQVEWGLEAYENQLSPSFQLGNVTPPLISAMSDRPLSPDAGPSPSRAWRQCSYDRECSRTSR